MAIARRATALKTAPAPMAPATGLLARTRTRPTVVDTVQPVAKFAADQSLQSPVAGIGHNSGPEMVMQAGPSIEDRLRDFFVANTEANAAKRNADSAKKALNEAMVRGQVKRATTNVTIGERVIPVEAVIEAASEEYIDVEVLKTLVSAELFTRIISATKTAVEAHAGKNMVIQTSKTRVKAEALTVKEIK